MSFSAPAPGSTRRTMMSKDQYIKDPQAGFGGALVSASSCSSCRPAKTASGARMSAAHRCSRRQKHRGTGHDVLRHRAEVVGWERVSLPGSGRPSPRLTRKALRAIAAARLRLTGYDLISPKLIVDRRAIVQRGRVARRCRRRLRRQRSRLFAVNRPSPAKYPSRVTSSKDSTPTVGHDDFGGMPTGGRERSPPVETLRSLWLRMGPVLATTPRCVLVDHHRSCARGGR